MNSNQMRITIRWNEIKTLYLIVFYALKSFVFLIIEMGCRCIIMWPISHKMNKNNIYLNSVTAKQSKYINILRGNIAHIITFNAIVIINNSFTGMNEIYIRRETSNNNALHMVWQMKLTHGRRRRRRLHES